MNYFKPIRLLSTVLRAVLSAVLMSGALVNMAQAAVKVHTSMSAESFYVGEEFTFEILVSGATKISVDAPDESDGVRVKFLTQITLPQNATQQIPSIAVRYRMMPTVVGEVHIPIFTIEADGQDFLTNEELFISVKRPEPYSGLELVRKIPIRDLYVGEAVAVDYQWKSPLPLTGFRSVDFKLPLFYDPAFKVRSFHQWIDGEDKAAIGLPVANTRVIARYGHFEEAGKFFNTVNFSKILIPLTPGEFLIQPATFLGSYIELTRNQRRARGWRTNYPSYFNNNFFEAIDGEPFKKYYTASSSTKLRVLPLPDAGKPDDFSGVVGKVSLKVSAVPQVVAAGDPITLKIVVGDIKFPEVMELPALDQQLAFTRQFAIPSKISRGQIEKYQKTFVITLRPRGQDVSAIPAVRIPYFDPETKTYGVAESAPIPITVKAAETATAFDAQVSGSGPLRNLLEGNPEGIRASFTDLPSTASGVSAKLWWMLAALLVPPMAFVIFLKATSRSRMRRRDPVRARAMDAWPRFKKSIRELESSSKNTEVRSLLFQLDTAVRGYMADRLNLLSHAHSFEDIATALHSKTSEGLDLDPIRQIYLAAEELGYRGKITLESGEPSLSRSEIKSLITSAKQCVENLNKK